MSRPPLLLIVVDGLRHDDHPTPVRIMPEYGFRDVEASLFTGTHLAVHQKWTDYAFHDRSPFGAASGIPGLDSLWHRIGRRQRRYLNFGIHRTAEFFSGWTMPRSSLIPPRLMRHVAPVQRCSPDEPQAYGDVESVFDVLRKTGQTWLYAAPPRMGPWGASDVRVEARVYSSLRHKPHDVYYVKFGDLDRVSHAYGPNSHQAARCRARTARRINHLIAEMTSRHRGMRWIVCSDHGFLPVTRHVAPPAWLQQLSREGRVCHFVDSTVIRVRALDRSMAASGVPALPTWDGAPTLEDADRAVLGLRWGSPPLGDWAYMAPHGTVFWPDFFSVAPPAGMHGYLPHPDHACPLEAHGFGQVPRLSSHAELGAWLKEILSNG